MDYAASNEKVNCELERMSKDAVVAYFKVLSHENISQDSRSPNRDRKLI
jgi:hypothetical protein